MVIIGILCSLFHCKNQPLGWKVAATIINLYLVLALGYQNTFKIWWSLEQIPFVVIEFLCLWAVKERRKKFCKQRVTIKQNLYFSLNFTLLHIWWLSEKTQHFCQYSSLIVWNFYSQSWITFVIVISENEMMKSLSHGILSN